MKFITKTKVFLKKNKNYFRYRLEIYLKNIRLNIFLKNLIKKNKYI
jgi:hypothetical protein